VQAQLLAVMTQHWLKSFCRIVFRIKRKSVKWASMQNVRQAKIGQVGFNAKCAACHGVNAAGKDGVAPPLVHKIYEPSHHGDESFQRAAALGVRAHHWPFGNMPAVEGVTRGDVKMITAYIRELQRANGIN